MIGVATLSAANPDERWIGGDFRRRKSKSRRHSVFYLTTEGNISMRYALLLPLALVGLAGCVTTTTPTPAPTTTTYVAPSPPASTTTVIRTP